MASSTKTSYTLKLTRKEMFILTRGIVLRNYFFIHILKLNYTTSFFLQILRLLIAILPSVIPNRASPLDSSVLDAWWAGGSIKVVAAPEGHGGTGSHTRRVGFLT